MTLYVMCIFVFVKCEIYNHMKYFVAYNQLKSITVYNAGYTFLKSLNSILHLKTNLDLNIILLSAYWTYLLLYFTISEKKYLYFVIVMTITIDKNIFSSFNMHIKRLKYFLMIFLMMIIALSYIRYFFLSCTRLHLKKEMNYVNVFFSNENQLLALKSI